MLWIERRGRQVVISALAIFIALGLAALSVSGTPPTPISIFLAAGQSNAQGMGDGYGPRVPSGKVLQVSDGKIVDANDPVGLAQTGSAWPAFGSAYHALSGKTVDIVNAGYGGSRQVSTPDVPDENWDDTGKLYARSVDMLDSAITALRAAGYAPHIAGVLWAQGESDGGLIEQRQVTADQYRVALLRMMARYRKRYGTELPFYFFLPPRGLGFTSIRDSQESVAASDPLSHIAFRYADTFHERGLMQLGVLHPRQAGYDEMGRIGAANVVLFERERQ